MGEIVVLSHLRVGFTEDAQPLAVDLDFGATAGADLAPSHAYERNGSFTVTLSATDQAGHTRQDTLRVTVLPISDPPQITAADQTTDEETLLSFTVGASDPNDVPPNALV